MVFLTVSQNSQCTQSRKLCSYTALAQVSKVLAPCQRFSLAPQCSQAALARTMSSIAQAVQAQNDSKQHAAERAQHCPPAPHNFDRSYLHSDAASTRWNRSPRTTIARRTYLTARELVCRLLTPCFRKYQPMWHRHIDPNARAVNCDSPPQAPLTVCTTCNSVSPARQICKAW